MTRVRVPTESETEVLLRSARRCGLCLGLRFDADEKPGQIAHLDGDPGNNSMDNLAWLCLYHHDRYDSRTSQSKGITTAEVKAHRNRLYELVVVRSQSSSPDAKDSIQSEAHNDEVLKILHRYEFIHDDQTDVLKQEAIARIRKLFSFCNSLVKEHERLADRSGESAQFDYDWAYDHLRQQYDLPDGVYGLNAEGELPAEWLTNVTELVEDWVEGWLKFDECTDLLWELDDRYDFDQHYVLFGIPNAKLSAVTYKLLTSSVYEFGMCNLRDKEPLE